MKIDRLIGIITLLLQNEKMTAPALAERFEVSRRTIGRDVEAICKAGIPIVTTQGANGGIAIMDAYKIDKTLFSDEDLRSIFAGLSSLDSVTQGSKYRNIIEKFTSRRDSLLLKNSLLIDLSSHYKDTLAPKIALLQSGIANHTGVSFRYHSQSGEHPVTADPYLVVFQWSSWYLLGLDNAAKQFKLYKLNRISNLTPTDINFELLEIPEEKLDFDKYFTNKLQAVILFEKSEAYRLMEEYGVDSYTETAQGRLRFSFPFASQSYLLSWVLSFGGKAELLEPSELRPIIKEQLKDALSNYCE